MPIWGGDNMGITFKPVDKNNLLDCVNLEVSEEQSDFE